MAKNKRNPVGFLGYHSKLDDPAAGSYVDLTYAVFSIVGAGALVVFGVKELAERNLEGMIIGCILLGLSGIAARFAWLRILGYRQYYIRRIRELDEEERARSTSPRGETGPADK
jgi:hypothetical protein